MRALPAILVFAALAVPAAADHCITWTTASPDADVAGFYIDNDPYQTEHMWSVWIYQESNGIAGLQRGDEKRDDTCHGMIRSDTVIF